MEESEQTTLSDNNSKNQHAKEHDINWHSNPNTPFLNNAMSKVSQVLSLIDKNKFSPTYGSMDRNFWHYKTIDFPTGMAQLGVLSLAYVYQYPFPESKKQGWYQNERIKELILAGMRYLPKCSHKDGTADEFYPFERALGATSFSLIAATEAYILMKLDEKDIIKFFRLRADWLVNNAEPAPIANHLAGAALALINVYLITNDKEYLIGAKRKIKETMALINSEGWFQEYDGCDIGYLTFTIDYMVKYCIKSNDFSSLETIKKAVEFCSYFIHPDGSFAGEYGSRNTSHFLPAGFVLIKDKIPLAGVILDKYRDGLVANKHEHMDDEKYFFYNVNNYLQAYVYDKSHKESSEEQNLIVLPCNGRDFSKHFESAKLYVRKQKEYYIIISIAKGGVAKIFKHNKLHHSFTGFIGKTEKGDVYSTQIFGSVTASIVTDDFVLIKGTFQKVSFKLQKTFNFFLLRAVMLTLGRSWKVGSFIKHVLVKKLITKKKYTTKGYEIKYVFKEDGIEFDAKISQEVLPLKELYETSDLALIHVPTSRYYQENNLLSWNALKIEKDTIVLNKKIS